MCSTYNYAFRIHFVLPVIFLTLSSFRLFAYEKFRWGQISCQACMCSWKEMENIVRAVHDVPGFSNLSPQWEREKKLTYTHPLICMCCGTLLLGTVVITLLGQLRSLWYIALAWISKWTTFMYFTESRLCLDHLKISWGVSRGLQQGWHPTHLE